MLAGTIGSAPLTNSAGIVGDVFTAHERGIAMCVYALMPFLGEHERRVESGVCELICLWVGPVFGPIVGGYVGSWKWRWLFWVTT
jgi:MFS family permease